MTVNVNTLSSQISATTATARTAYPINTQNTNAVTIHNLGTVHAHVKSGDSTVTATASDMFIPPASSRTFLKNVTDTHLAAITGTLTATVLFHQDSI